MLLLMLVSNLSFNISITFVLSMLKRDVPLITSSFARMRALTLFSSFLQIVCMVASQADGVVGGKCRPDQTIPYLFDVMYGLQTAVLLLFIFEKLFGFGSEGKAKKDTNSEEDKNQNGKGKKSQSGKDK